MLKTLENIMVYFSLIASFAWLFMMTVVVIEELKE
tara:strand:+ start:476 stop:580 length:105 start_codon:yes stop_codon:yes gene_type:complete